MKVYGPSDEYVSNFTVLTGFGTNLRTALNANNLRLYDDRTARFDSPYQTGNCGGEGTCGTCVVAVVQGRAYQRAGEGGGPGAQEARGSAKLAVVVPRAGRGRGGG